ncbi:hypothetical protein MGYG_02623 [Nannizzia gypsea CBS 118893]|uniref:DUF6594 domain-containing protein n=1 Tax=Arthroderma gypseum (strain ATCC MYA-4604 / CBS 118893) TaxID=535722 RepID=E4UNK1_ARTGP|nr:hypothetical protein MGYG_02623 [Nannizzia gypsea CBS 118893]EFQ99609.1 hypothetical protein MGYG_02623 [Nannizzia gypsea CBS 118893]
MAPGKTKKSKKASAVPLQPPPPPPPPLDFSYAIPEAELAPDHGYSIFNEPLDAPYEEDKEFAPAPTSASAAAARRRAASRASEPPVTVPLPATATSIPAVAAISTSTSTSIPASVAPIDPAAAAVFSYLDQPLDEQMQMRPSAHSRKASEPVVPRAPRPKDHSRKASLSQLLRTVSGGSSSSATAKEKDKDKEKEKDKEREREKERDLSPSRSSSVSKESEYQPVTPPDMLFDPINLHIPGSKGMAKSHMAGSYMTDTESLLEGPTSAAPAFMNFSHPESFYVPKSMLSYSMAPPPPTKHHHHHHHPQQQQQQQHLPHADKAPTTEASRRRSQASVPEQFEWTAVPETPHHVYRKFERLNHRVLRHLQEEIAQLEDDLITIDDIDAARAGASGSRASSRQKQLAAKYRDQIQDYSILQNKRTDLLDKIMLKTDQYNRALCSFSKVIKNLPAASDDDVDAYRAFLRSPAGASTKGERKLLDQRADLVTMAPRPASALHSNPLYSTVAAIFAAILFPLLAFGAITEFFGRIVVVSFVAGSFAWWASNGPPGHDYLIEPQDGWKCAVIYFGFMTMAALLL